MSKTDPKPYKVTNTDIKYEKDFYSEENDKGVSYPQNKITVSKVEYEGEYKNRDGKNIAYEGDKIVITNCKLELDQGVVARKKKVIKYKDGNDRIIDDSQSVSISEDQLNDLISELS